MNEREFEGWCSESGGTKRSINGESSQMACVLEDKTVHFGGDDIVVESHQGGAIAKVEGPADEFFNMGRAQLAIEAGDVSLQFQK